MPAQGLELTTFCLRSDCQGITFFTGICVSSIDHFATVGTMRTLNMSLKTILLPLAALPIACTYNWVGVQLHLTCLASFTALVSSILKQFCQHRVFQKGRTSALGKLSEWPKICPTPKSISDVDKRPVSNFRLFGLFHRRKSRSRRKVDFRARKILRRSRQRWRRQNRRRQRRRRWRRRHRRWRWSCSWSRRRRRNKFLNFFPKKSTLIETIFGSHRWILGNFFHEENFQGNKKLFLLRSVFFLFQWRRTLRLYIKLLFQLLWRPIPIDQ